MTEEFLTHVKAAQESGLTSLADITNFVADAIEAETPKSPWGIDRPAFRGAVQLAINELAKSR